MFDLNFISEPGLQNKNSDASWSFLEEKSESDLNGKSESKQSQRSLFQQNSWKNYAFVLVIVGFIGWISILNIPHTQIKADWVLNQVIDLIIESVYIENLQLAGAKFDTDQVKVTIYSDDFTTIQSLSQGYHKGNEIPYEIYKKGEFNYLSLIFPWQGNESDGDVQTLQYMADKTVFSKMTSINHTEDIFEMQGQSSDIISFLLGMADNKQIQKFIFSVSQYESDRFNLKVQLNHI